MKQNTHTSLALLLMAYGTPETPDDIEAYYTDVRRGNPPDAALLKELQDRYAAIGGTTPLRKITEKQALLLDKRLGIPTFVGMKHWHPYIKDAIKQIAKAGIKEIVALVMAPHYSTMSIGDYKNRLQKAIDEVAPGIQVTLIEHWGDNPVFIDSLCERIEDARKDFPDPDFEKIHVVFTAHSLPIKILESGDPYPEELRQTSNLAAKKLRLSHWTMAFQSAGRTRDTWLGPDILTELQTLAASGKDQVLIAPIGFTTDNLELLYDLDIQAAEVAQKLGLICKRIPSANASPRFIDALEAVVKPFISSK